MRMMVMSVAVVIAFGLAGCASTSSQYGVARKDRQEVDSARVAAINAWSLRRGVNVTWINPPVKRVPAESGLRD